MKRISTAKVVRVTGGAENELVRILEVRENEENPRKMYADWRDQMKGSLGKFEMVVVETEEI